jgi:hypothetical protein
MDCVCGCGRDLHRKLADRNYIAAAVALELLAWDKNRAAEVTGPDGREALIARGADSYAWLISSLHGEVSADPDDAANAWLAEAAEMRAGRTDMTQRRLLFGDGSPNLSEEDMARIDRRHPELTFTGTAAPESAPDAAGPAGSDPSDNLARLRLLHDDGVLTDAEFEAAKARLPEG